MTVITPVKIALAPELAIIDPTMPKDPEVRKLANDVLARLKYSLAIVASEDQPAANGDLERAFRAYLSGRKAVVRSNAKAAAAALVHAPETIRTRTFGRYAAVSAADFSKLSADQLTGRIAKLAVAEQPLLTAAKKISAALVKLPKGYKTTDPDAVAGAAYKHLVLSLNSVRCIEETDEIGSDEIAMGGTVTNPVGATGEVSQFMISDDFDQGEIKQYGAPGKQFHAYPLHTGANSFPYVYAAAIALCEKDDGGFADFLKTLWDKVGDAVKSAISGAVSAAIGAAIGSAFGFIGTIVGTVVGLLIGWLISLFDNPDDMIGVKTLVMSLGAATKSYYDWAQLTSSGGYPITLDFKGDGGRYQVKMSYHVTA